MNEEVKILFLADEPDKGIWDFYTPGKLDGYDLIISCGDLPPQYLDFLATYFKGPVLYVHGNHDEVYVDAPPSGCISIEGKIFEFKGIKIAGLGGSMEYSGGIFQFDEKTMRKRVNKLIRKIRFNGGIDIFVTHSPAADLNDSDDLPHKGFKCFHTLLDKCKPRILAHGHIHMSYSYNQPRLMEHNGTTVINAYQKFVAVVKEGQIDTVETGVL